MDRQAFEQLFGVKDRRARVLMSRLDGIKIGNAWAVDRLKLIAALEKIRTGQEYEFEVKRKERVAEILQRAKREHPARQIVIQVKPQDQWMTMDALPPDVQISRKKLRIRFQGIEDLTAKLMQVGLAMQNDYDEFRKMTENGQ